MLSANAWYWPHNIDSETQTDLLMASRSLVTGPRVEEAMHRSVRWLDRCIAAHAHPDRQNLFCIIQGGLDPELRKQCVAGMGCIAYSPSPPTMQYMAHGLSVKCRLPLLCLY